MLHEAIERRIRLLVLLCTGLITLAVTPWMNLDPINLPKLLILLVSGFGVLGYLVPSWRNLLKSNFKALTIAATVFVVFLIIALIASKAANLSELYGVFGRNTGFFTYFSLAILMIASAIISNREFTRKLLWVLIASGSINVIYGLIQWVGIDPVSWNNPYNPIVGTLGNPNFTSSLLGIAGIALLAFALDQEIALWLRIALIANMGLSLWIIYKSDSSQGILIFLLGSVLVFYYRFFRGKSGVWISRIYWIVVSFAAFVGILGIFNRGPLAPILFQDSVVYRGDYWRAGWNMTMENPLFGVGLDSYGDFYRFYRDSVATLRRGPEVTSNSAHNVLLDISSNGGFPLLAAYLSILILVMRSCMRILRRTKSFDSIGIGLVSAWTAYLCQSIVSINQLALAIWGWVLGGAIIGYDWYSGEQDALLAKGTSNRKPENSLASNFLIGTTGLILGFSIAVLPIAQDISFRNALQRSEVSSIERAANQFPRNSYYYLYAARIFLDNRLYEKSMVAAKAVIKVNPRDFYAWNLLLSNPELSGSEREVLIEKMKELDPFNQNLGK